MEYGPSITRRSLAIGGLFAAASLVLSTAPVSAQTGYPNKPIRVIVPFASGGSVDGAARMIGQRLSERLGQPVVVENKPGAGGSVGSEYVARSAPDGYTLVWGTVSTHAILGSLNAKLSYDNLKDFAPVTKLTEQPLLLVVPKDSPVNSVQDMVRVQKQNPGKANFGSPGIGSTGHLTGELLKRTLGADMTHITYRGSNPMLLDLVAGRLDLGIDNLPSALAQVKGGNLKAIAITTLERSSMAPEIPALSETLPGFQVVAWQGLFAPAGTPEPILDRLATEVHAVLREPEVKAQLLSIGNYPSTGPRTEFAAFVKQETERWAVTVKESGAKFDE